VANCRQGPKSPVSEFPQADASVSSAHILVVDDNPATRYSTSRVLRGAGFTVVEAATGNEGLQLVRSGVDLVVLDVNLPDIDGFEVCRQIRQVDALRFLPVVHLSATFVTDDAKAHGMDVGANGYLVHPVEPLVLIATISAFLRAWRAEQERNALLESERAARAEAERANQFKDEFLATLSHELRTPLHAIIGWTQLIKTNSLSADEIAEGISVIERNAQAQSQMIADLLDVSRITTGKLRLDVQPVDPSSTIEAALVAVLPAATAKGIRVTKSLDATAGPILGDPSRLQQIVWNLVNNAVKFTPKGGKIDIALKRFETHIELSVADNGQGIDSNQLTRIFDRFHQGDASITRTHGGLGLGLAISKQLVELHGGQISAESAGPGQGACFRVTLPVATAASKADAAEKARELAASPKPRKRDYIRLDNVRVLLVDDDRDARQMLSRTLEACGAQVVAIEGAAHSLTTISTFKPQVLISDLGMPNRDGYQLIQEVRSSGHSAESLPAIALTGFARPEDRRRALLAGFQMHMSKPVDPQELAAAVAMLIGH
jgi:signal transduction histidine kinase